MRFADEVEQSGGQPSNSANTSSIQDFLLKMAGQPLPENKVQMIIIIVLKRRHPK